MKSSLTLLPDLYATWMSTGWSMLMGKAPAGPAKEPILKPAQVTAGHDWQHKRDSIKLPKKSRTKPAPKLARRSPARRAAPAKKRRKSPKAKGASRR